MSETNRRAPLTGWMWAVLITVPLGFLIPALAEVIHGRTVNAGFLSTLPCWLVLPMIIAQNPDERRRHRVLGWGGVIMGVVLGAFALLVFWFGRLPSADAQLWLLTGALQLLCTLVLLTAGAMLLRRSATLPPPALPR